MFNVALIGNGYWGSKLRTYINLNEEFSLKYVCDSETDLRPIWDDVDCVVEATRNEARFNIVKLALLKGKHVFSEKPLTLDVIKANYLKRLAKRNKVQLAVDYTWTFSEGIKKMIDSIELIGDIKGIDMTVKHLGRFYGGSVYWLLGSHMLSILDMIIPLKDLRFKKFDLVRNDGDAESGLILFGNSKLSGSINLSLNYPDKEIEIVIYGSEGTISFTPYKDPTLSITNYDRPIWNVNIPVKSTEYVFDEYDNLKYAIDYFARLIKGEVGSNIDTAIKITQILENLQL